MSGPVELWTMGAGVPRAGTRVAERAEAEGWDGLLVVDSQNLTGDCYVAMALMARATTRLKLGTGVTNPWTRHPAVTASAIATVQAESDGRAVLGIGRGDSALAHLGLAPAPVSVFASYLERLQAYLRGEEIPLDDHTVDNLQLADAPTTSRIHWIRPSMPKVPVDVAASGPKVIGLGATLADRVTFAVGADPDRLQWALATARAARTDAGLDPDTLEYGAFVNVVAHPDRAVARRLAEGGLASFARFSVMHGTVAGPVSDEQREVFSAVHHAYDMNVHTQAGTPQAAALTEDFSDRFAILGPADECVARLRDLVAMGIRRFGIIGPSLGADREEAVAAAARFVNEVMPAVRD